MENQPQQFNVENSPMREAYELLGAHTPKELNNLYSDADQELMRSKEWDYDNPDLIVNKIKDILEVIDVNSLTEDEKEWQQEILWFWYHHAISCAFYKKNDREKAKMFAKKAIEIQPKNNPNKITRLLYLLVNGKIDEAEEWANSIPEDKLDDGTDNPELETAKDLVEGYKKHFN